MVNIKSKLRSVLGNLIHVHDSFKTSTRSRIVDKHLLRHFLPREHELPSSLNALKENNRPLLRVLATSENHAQQIYDTLKSQNDTLNIKSLHLINEALDFHKKKLESQVYTHSVLIGLDPRELLQSACSTTNLEPEHLISFIHPALVAQPENLVIDFSSPNIAKPFHFGHLKSTILGNFLSNLNKFLGAKVTKLNYIGDWGTQYGLLSLGIERFGGQVHKSSRSNLRYLVDLYVKANEQAGVDNDFYEEAKRRFAALDTGVGSDGSDNKLLEQWKNVRDLSLDELKDSYDQLGIEFDVYEHESEYSRCGADILGRLDPMIIVKRPDGVVVAFVQKNNRQIEVPLIKSDGTSLYITRDIAAALSRYSKYKFDRMLYVVGADQERHFYHLADLVSQCGAESIDKSKLVHVKMGKILGMSTRSGNFALLSDILAETSKKYAELTSMSPTTRTNSKEDVKRVSRQLALSALFVHDMSKARMQNYEFSWESVMNVGSRTGLNLQTTHARLFNLMNRAHDKGIELADESHVNVEAINCLEASNLLSVLSEFDVAMNDSYWSNDAVHLVNHAFRLCNVANRARQSSQLRIVGESDANSARTKLLMFSRTRDQLELIIRLLGLKPLDRT